MGASITIKLNQPLLGFYEGQVIKLGRGHVPLDKFWLGRIKDSAIDNCITIIKEPKESEKAPEELTIPTNTKKKVRKHHGNK